MNHNTEVNNKVVDLNVSFCTGRIKGYNHHYYMIKIAVSKNDNSVENKYLVIVKASYKLSSFLKKHYYLIECVGNIKTMLIFIAMRTNFINLLTTDFSQINSKLWLYL